eukprot:3468149-Lingulodinium_polyedra.AAC.1
MGVDSVYFWFIHAFAKLARRGSEGGQMSEPKMPEPGELSCSNIYISSVRSQSVVERDEALLTPQETREHGHE